jgi:hypothetical protein
LLLNEFLITAAVSIVILGLCILLNANAETTWGRYGSLSLLVVLIATLPIWASLLFIVIGSFQSNGMDRWAGAPWIMIIATYKYIGQTISVAVVTATLYFGVRGEPERKLAVAAVVSMVLLAGLAWRANVQRLNAAQARRVSAREAGALRAFVSSASEPRKVAAPPVTTWVIRNIERDGLPVRYALAVKSQATSQGTVVIVDVDRSAGGPRFSWICSTNRDLFDWEVNDPCKASN